MYVASNFTAFLFLALIFLLTYHLLVYAVLEDIAGNSPDMQGYFYSSRSSSRMSLGISLFTFLSLGNSSTGSTSSNHESWPCYSGVKHIWEDAY